MPKIYQGCTVQDNYREINYILSSNRKLESEILDWGFTCNTLKRTLNIVLQI